ncbi:MAG: hypothetical protein IPN05_12300 [Sulfuritalea sp.]|nr:hypothetical protein [Sulfuritalea sp.]
MTAKNKALEFFKGTAGHFGGGFRRRRIRLGFPANAEHFDCWRRGKAALEPCRKLPAV